MAHSASSLLINVNDLLSLQGVEKQRVEFKKAWHGRKEGGTYWQVIRTICAFANDFYNDNGGYIIIGVEEKENWEDEGDDRQIILPPLGVPAKDLDRIQKEILGACRANIKPEYFPILSPEVVECPGEKRKHVLVLWAMVSDNRPHTCKESEKGENRYYIRRGTETKKASPEEIEQLLYLKNKIPFDDRRAIDNSETGKQLSEDTIDIKLVKTFLKDIGSKLREHNDKDPLDLLERLTLLRNVGDKRVGDALKPVWVPRNVALLFFHQEPHEFFRGARTEIALYSDNDETEEVPITGPIDQQIGKILDYILKQTKEAARHEYVAYPVRALREAVVNAFYHRSYEHCHCDPIKIHIKPNCIDVISYPGPNPTLKEEHFTEGSEVPCVPSRNRRIGDFLKERKLAEGRFTGVRTIFKSMKQNKNPKPSFSFSSEYFSVRLPGHPKYLARSILRDVDNLCAKGEDKDAVQLLKTFLDEHLTHEHPSIFPDIIGKLLELHENDANHPNVQEYKSFISDKLKENFPLIEELRKWCVAEEMKDISIGVALVKQLVAEGATCDDLDHAISKAVHLNHNTSYDKQQVLESVQNAHKLFEAMGYLTQTNAYVAFQFACCKFNLYLKNCHGHRQRKDLISYLKAAEDYVYKATQLTDDEHKYPLAKQYRQLGYIHSQLCLIQKSTEEHIINNYDKARRYNPDIRISSVFIPPRYRSLYMPTGNWASPVGNFSGWNSLTTEH